MKIRIDFHYPISFVPYRHQNTQTRTGSASTSVTIREIEAADAPVAFRVGNHDGTGGYGDSSHAFDRKPDGSMRDIRAFHDRLFVEVGSAEGLQGSVDEDVNATVFKPCKARTSIAAQRHGHQQRLDWTIEQIKIAERQPLRTYTDDKGARVAKLLARRAAQLLIIDGVLYQECAEPVLKIDNNYGRITVFPRPQPYYRPHYDELGLHQSSYGYDHFEHLASAHCLLAAERDKTLEMQTSWEVVNASYSNFDGTAYDISNGVRELLRNLEADAKGLPRKALEAMYLLKEAFDDADHRATPRLIDALAAVGALDRDIVDASRLKAVDDRLNRGQPVRYGSADRSVTTSRREGYDKDAVGRAAKTARKLVGRWNARPATGWETNAPSVSSIREKTTSCRELLSPGQIIDACHAAKTDPIPVLAAAQEGVRIFQVNTGPNYSQTYSIGLMNAEGEITVHGEIDSDLATRMVDGLIDAADRSVETAFELVPLN